MAESRLENQKQLRHMVDHLGRVPKNSLGDRKTRDLKTVFIFAKSLVLEVIRIASIRIAFLAISASFTSVLSSSLLSLPSPASPENNRAKHLPTSSQSSASGAMASFNLSFSLKSRTRASLCSR